MWYSFWKWIPSIKDFVNPVVVEASFLLAWLSLSIGAETWMPTVTIFDCGVYLYHSWHKLCFYKKKNETLLIFFWYLELWDSTVEVGKKCILQIIWSNILQWKKNRKIQTFVDIENWLWMSKFHDFYLSLCHLSVTDIKK